MNSQAHNPFTFALRVEGDSMTAKEPGTRSYPHGTVIYVDTERKAANGDRVVAHCVGGEHIFRELFEEPGRKYLKAINSDYQPIAMTEKMHVLGVVSGSYRED